MICSSDAPGSHELAAHVHRDRSTTDHTDVGIAHALCPTAIQTHTAEVKGAVAVDYKNTEG
jgi:hypothetical protein